MNDPGDWDAEPGQAKGNLPPLCQPFTLRAEKDIPARRWLYGRWAARGFVSSLLGKGGVGKTSLYIVESLAIITGRALLGIKPVEIASVWILNLEEPADEMERRIAAAARRHGITQDMISGRLFVDALLTTPFVIANHSSGGGVAINYKIVNAIIDNIERRLIGLLVVDPLVATHALDENDNTEMNAAVMVWRMIAARTGCVILLCHHLPKGRVSEDDDSGRGAVALRDGVRTSRLMRPMEAEQAQKLGVVPTERRQFVLVGDAKSNLAELGVGDWMRLTPMTLDNSDVVGTAEAWKPPSDLDGVDPDMLNQVVAWLAENGPQRSAVQSPAWFGWKVAELCAVQGANAREPEAKAKAVAVLRTLANQGRIRIVIQKHDARDTPFWEPVT
jgi:hypothetical protein